MKNIKSYKEFLILEDEEQSPGEILAFQLSEFKSKQENLKSLILTNVDTDKDITQNLEDVVGENPFLQMLSSLYKMDAAITTKESKLKEIEEEVKTVNNDINLVDKLSDDTDKEEQHGELQEKIKELQKTYEDGKKSIKEIGEQRVEMEKQMQYNINQKTEELRNIQNNTFQGETS